MEQLQFNIYQCECGAYTEFEQSKKDKICHACHGTNLEVVEVVDSWLQETILQNNF